jgi:5-methylcytosine-specific restriction endonuclease McrA
MATGAPRPCTAPGCRALVIGASRCPVHARAVRRGQDAQRAGADERGYGTRWKKARATFLAHHPLCARCGARATVVDHIVPHRGDWELFWVHGDYEKRPNEPGWQPLCARCHSSKTAQQDGRWGPVLMRPAAMRKSRVPLTVVAGPPGAGKSTLIERHAGADDLVLDLDRIKAELSGLPLFHADHAVWGQRALEERNRRLLGLCGPRPLCRRAWLVTGAPAAHERRWWREQAGARVVLVLAPLEECLRRALADPRRPPRWLASLESAVRTWFSRYTADPTERVVRDARAEVL